MYKKFLISILILLTINLHCSDLPTKSSVIEDFAKALISGYFSKIAYEIFKKSELDFPTLIQIAFTKMLFFRHSSENFNINRKIGNENTNKKNDEQNLYKKKLSELIKIKRTPEVNFSSVSYFIFAQTLSIISGLDIFYEWDGSYEIFENENPLKLNLIKAVGRLIGMSLPFNMDTIKNIGTRLIK